MVFLVCNWLNSFPVKSSQQKNWCCLSDRENQGDSFNYGPRFIIVGVLEINESIFYLTSCLLQKIICKKIKVNPKVS